MSERVSGVVVYSAVQGDCNVNLAFGDKRESLIAFERVICAASRAGKIARSNWKVGRVRY